MEAFEREQDPSTAVERLPDFEKLMGVGLSNTAVVGTIRQRQRQVVSRFREPGAASLPGIRALLQPYLQYKDPSQIQIVETSRDTLRTAHTYAMGAVPLTIPIAAAPVSVSTTVLDDPAVSSAGAQIFIELSGPLEQIEFTLRGPGGQPADTVYFRPGYLGRGSVTNAQFRLDAPELAGRRIQGTWTLFTLSRGVATGTLHSAGCFVEGIGLDGKGGQGLGSAIYEWAVIVDPLLLGAEADILGARAALQRITPSHTQGILVVKKGGALLAIPDELTTLPDISVPA